MNDYAYKGMCCYLSNHPIYKEEHYETGEMDFPCSQTFRDYYEERVGRQSPEVRPTIEAQEPKQIAIKTIHLTNKETGLIESLKGQIVYLDKKVRSLQVRSAKPKRALYR